MTILVKQKLSPLFPNIFEKRNQSYTTYVKDVHTARHEQQHEMCECPAKKITVSACMKTI